MCITGFSRIIIICAVIVFCCYCCYQWMIKNELFSYFLFCRFCFFFHELQLLCCIYSQMQKHIYTSSRCYNALENNFMDKISKKKLKKWCDISILTVAGLQQQQQQKTGRKEAMSVKKGELKSWKYHYRMITQFLEKTSIKRPTTSYRSIFFFLHCVSPCYLCI